ncbi:MAG TPA: HU family DNA-binding protein [Clostridiales bacterium]|nr:HU family DNA-binding protein [Clostridiales bacterium]
MNKGETIHAVAEKSGVTKKDTEAVINALGEIITNCLAKGEEVRFIGFGAFSVKERAARRGRNPQTGESIDIPPTKQPVFRCGKLLRAAVK